jgi:hypothetical protein
VKANVDFVSQRVRWIYDRGILMDLRLGFDCENDFLMNKRAIDHALSELKAISRSVSGSGVATKWDP